MSRFWYIGLVVFVALVSTRCNSGGGSSSTVTEHNQIPTETVSPQPPPTAVPFVPNAKDAAVAAVNQRLQDYHCPFGLVFSALYNTPDTKDLFKWDGVGDSALWSGVYLASLSFRYQVTKDPAVQTEALRVLEAIRKLSLINGNGLLARHVYPLDRTDLQAYINDNPNLDNVQTGTLEGQTYYYTTHTSRDQYSGVFFGLGVAYDLLEDSAARATIKDVVTRLTNYLVQHNWATINEDGSIFTVFVQEPNQQLSILQVARHVNPEQFETAYQTLAKSSAANAWIPLYVEGADAETSYYKFNVSHLYMYNLLRLEAADSPYMKDYQKAYATLKTSTDGHQNAHFNMVDRAILGPDVARDAETVKLLDQLLAKNFKQSSINLRGKYQECKPDRACDPVPMPDRYRTEFIWQTPPWDLYVEGDDRIESAGVDILITYWMSRYYRVQ